MRAMLPLLILCLLPGCREETAQACEAIRFDEQPFTVCRFAADDPGLALFRTHPDGAPFADFSRLAETISADGGELVFAMNAGMYHDDRRPVGLYIEDGGQQAARERHQHQDDGAQEGHAVAPEPTPRVAPEAAAHHGGGRSRLRAAHSASVRVRGSSQAYARSTNMLNIVIIVK